MKKHIISGLLIFVFFLLACEQNPVQAPLKTTPEQSTMAKRADTDLDEASPDMNMPVSNADFNVYIRKGYEASGAWRNGSLHGYLSVYYDYENDRATLRYSVYQNRTWIADGHGDIPPEAITGDERIGYLSVNVDTGELDGFHVHAGEPLVISATWTVNSDWVRYNDGRDVFTDNRTGYSSYYKGRRNYRSADGQATLGNWSFSQPYWSTSVWLAKFKHAHAWHYGNN